MVANFGDFEQDLKNNNLTDLDRAARRFARMCHMYGPTGRINFHSEQFCTEIVAAGMALLRSNGFNVEPVNPTSSARLANKFDLCVLVTSKPPRAPHRLSRAATRRT